MLPTLTEIEARVLGALIEKEITTPEYYPLSLNALVNACNQKSNRDPLMTLNEDSVRSALRALDELFYARSAATDSRVVKFEHRLQEAFNFLRPDVAILCELLLRGPQTPGELRSRAERMHPFADLGEVHSALQRLMKREPPLVTLLPRQHGAKEVRYTHLFFGAPKARESASPAAASSSATHSQQTHSAHSPESARIAALEAELQSFRDQLATLQSQFAAFQKQFQ